MLLMHVVVVGVTKVVEQGSMKISGLVVVVLAQSWGAAEGKEV